MIVKPVSKEEVTASGIILPDTVGKERPKQGDVIEIGPGLLLENGTRQTMSVKVGDRVIFKQYAPDEFKIDEQDYLVLAETDIMAVIEK